MKKQTVKGKQKTNRPQTGRHTRPKRRKFYEEPVLMAAVIVCLVVSMLGTGVWALYSSTLGRIRRSNQGVTPNIVARFPEAKLNNPIPYDKDITNILLMGVDSRDKESIRTRSDSMMVLTINRSQKKVKLTSLQRDMLVYIPGRENPDKLTHVNAYGGPELLMRVISDTLRLDLDGYVVVNMKKMEEVVDAAGGVELDIKQEDISAINEIIRAANLAFPDSPQVEHLISPGKQMLNGRQAVSYARNRTTGNGDYSRMSRQQEVIQALFDRFMTMNMVDRLSVLASVADMVTTNLKDGDILGLVQSVLPAMSKEIDKMYLPLPGYHREYMGDMWVNLCDFNGMIPELQKFIFGKTFAFDPVREIPGAPNSSVDLPHEYDPSDWVASDSAINDVISDDSYDYNQQVDPDYDWSSGDAGNGGQNQPPAETETPQVTDGGPSVAPSQEPDSEPESPPEEDPVESQEGLADQDDPGLDQD